MSPKKLPIIFFALLTACATHENGWTPTIDTAKDTHIDALQTDLAACKRLAEQAGEKALTGKTKNTMVTDDGIEINGSVFRRTYINCMKERKHPVVD